MYAFTNNPNVPATSEVSPSADANLLRRTLDAVYRERVASLLVIARRHARNGDDASDALQDAFVHVLAHPPLDPSKRALTVALETALRTACERQRRHRRDEAAMKVGLRKRFPV
jgi:DNA-directed RNA polymerase specialized sigma24 family protein